MQSVSPDEKVRKNAARAGIPPLSSASRILLKGAPSSAPNGFIEIPIHPAAFVRERHIDNKNVDLRYKIF